MTSGLSRRKVDEPGSLKPFHDFPSFKGFRLLGCFLNFFQTTKLSWIVYVREV